MKIAILTYMFPPDDVAGIEIVSQDMSNHLAQRGNEVYVVTSGKKNVIENPKENITVYRVTKPRTKFLGNPIFWLKIFFALKKIKPDIVHCQAVQMGVPGFLFKKIYEKPYIVCGHGDDIYLPWKFKRIIAKLVFENAETVIALTKDMKKKIESFGFNVKNIFVVPNGIELEKFKVLSKINIRKELEISEDKKVVLFVGTLTPRKGIKYLIEALNIVKQKNPNIKLLLIGDGDQKQGLEKLAETLDLKKNISFVGKVENKEIPKYMTASDIFVLPSLSEAFGVVNLEAMACGLPIIATRVDGIPDVVKDRENGFLVEPESPNQIAEKILYLLSNDNVRKTISQNNIKESNKYSWENIIEKIEKIYSGVLNKSNK